MEGVCRAERSAAASYSRRRTAVAVLEPVMSPSLGGTVHIDELCHAARSVVIQQTTQPGTPTDPALGLNTSSTLNQPIPQPLMVPLTMIMSHEILDGSSKVALANRNDPIEALLFNGSYKSSSGGESHPSALTEPYVRLSPHTAPTIQPPASRRAATGQRAAGPVARCAPASAWTHALDAEIVCISVAPTQRGPHSDAGGRDTHFDR